MEQIKPSHNFEPFSMQNEINKDTIEEGRCLIDDTSSSCIANHHDPANRVRQIKAILAESKRWLKLPWVQKKLEKRFAEVLKGSSEPFEL